MGKLYDSRDLRWNVQMWDRVEAQLYADISAGVLPKSLLHEIKTYPGGPGRPARHLRYADCFDYERQRERFKLLRTGMLLGELKRQEALFKNCTQCYTEVPKKGRRKGQKIMRACDLHKDGLAKAKSDVFWAGKRNLAERLERGQKRDDADWYPLDDLVGTELKAHSTEEPQNPLNEWELWYYKDRSEGVWADNDREWHVQEYGSHDYRGWLRMLLEEEEITEAAYLAETKRLRDAEQEAQESSTGAMAGRNSLKLTARQRDTRHNRLLN